MTKLPTKNLTIFVILIISLAGCDLNFYSTSSTVFDGRGVKLLEATGINNPAWTPDGSQIAYSRRIFITTFYKYFPEENDFKAFTQIETTSEYLGL